jgi:hypothetical protein
LSGLLLCREGPDRKCQRSEGSESRTCITSIGNHFDLILTAGS